MLNFVNFMSLRAPPVFLITMTGWASEAVRKSWGLLTEDSIGEPKKPLALSEQKIALSVAEWVEGVAISLLRKFEIALLCEVLATQHELRPKGLAMT